MKSARAVRVLLWMMLWSHLSVCIYHQHSYDPVTQGFMTADGKPYNGDITTLPVRGPDPSASL
jgi:hypothetical protein